VKISVLFSTVYAEPGHDVPDHGRGSVTAVQTNQCNSKSFCIWPLNLVDNPVGYRADDVIVTFSFVHSSKRVRFVRRNGSKLCVTVSLLVISFKFWQQLYTAEN